MFQNEFLHAFAWTGDLNSALSKGGTSYKKSDLTVASRAGQAVEEMLEMENTEALALYTFLQGVVFPMFQRFTEDCQSA